MVQIKSKIAMGPSFEQMIDDFDRAVEAVRVEGEKIIIVSHDWGTLIAHGYEHRHGSERIHKMVTLDVGSFAQPKVKRPSPLPPFWGYGVYWVL